MSLKRSSASSRARTAATAAGSLLIHAAVIGVASFQPVMESQATPTPTTIISLEPPGTEGLLLIPTPDVLVPESVSVPPPLPGTETDAPPIAEDSQMADPTDAPESTPKLNRPRSLKLPSPPPNARNGTLHGAEKTPTGAGNGLLGAAGTGAGKPAVGWRTPPPVYPYLLRAAHQQGRGSVQVSTDASGQVVSATIVQSAGSAIFDSNTVSFAKGNWSGPPNTTRTVPIIYRLR